MGAILQQGSDGNQYQAERHDAGRSGGARGNHHQGREHECQQGEYQRQPGPGGCQGGRQQAEQQQRVEPADQWRQDLVYQAVAVCPRDPVRHALLHNGQVPRGQRYAGKTAKACRAGKQIAPALLGPQYDHHSQQQGGQQAEQGQCLLPEELGHRPFDRTSGYEARCDVDRRPCQRGQQVDGHEAQGGHVQHASHHGNDGAYRADEPADEYTQQTIAPEERLAAGNPLRMSSEQADTSDILVQRAAECKAEQVAEDRAAERPCQRRRE